MRLPANAAAFPLHGRLGYGIPDRPGAEVIARRTLKSVNHGCVILLHDGRGVEEGADLTHLVEGAAPDN